MSAAKSLSLSELLSREWIETNGLGGWASSTLALANTRRYHGLLIAALRPPSERRVLLSRFDETVRCEDETVELGTRIYPGAILPEGYRTLRFTTRDPFPRFEFETAQFHLEKTILAVPGKNATLVRYRVLRARNVLHIEGRIFLAGRDYHSLLHRPGTAWGETEFREGQLAIRGFAGGPDLFLSLPKASFLPAPDWYYQFLYQEEESRGLDCREDLFTPGSLAFSLAEEEECFLLASTEEHHRETPLDLYQQALEKRTSLSKNLPHSDPLSEKLSLAAEQFLVRRGDGGKTIIAGYHWFTDWGRDTMIALPGLCLLSGQFEMAKAILGEFRKHLSQGMLPNRFPDEGGEPEYNTIDATLWYFLALYRYVEYTNDSAFLREILPHLLDIHRWHREGTRYGIRVDSDGLLQGGDESTQLTWMDAKVGNWVVTPRHGKAVEINALWYNALQILAVFQERLGEPAAASARFREEAEQLRISFLEVFRNTNEGLLYDCVRGDHRDDRFRPNQLFALSLPFPLLEEQEAERILERMEAELLTPRGLRTLSPKHPEYQPRYLGDQLRRDGSYHQGTVWPWLLGPWATALVRFRGERGRQQAETLYRQFFDHLEEAGLGTVSEIFDGDAPHTPRGCIAQAWSVAELLRGYQEDIRGKVPQYSFSGESFT